MARVYYPNIQKPASNKRESGPKEKKGGNTASTGGKNEKKEGAAE